MTVLTVLCARETLSKEGKNGGKIKAKLDKALEIVQIFTELGRNKTGCKNLLRRKAVTKHLLSK